MYMLLVESADALKRLELPAMASEMRKFKEAVKTLGEKKETVYFTKADKSNNIVIFDKEEYIELTNEFIENGPYELVNFDPLPGMIRRTKAAISEAAKVFVKEDRLTLKLHVSNPSIPRMYTQLKTHKQGMKLRPITPNNNSPTQRLAMWLLKKFNLMKIKFETASIKNTIEFVDKIKNIKPADNEMQVSFDVDNLYTNIPMDIGLEVLRIWLIENNVNIMEVNALVSLTRLCMEESWFRFNNNYYRQQYGCSMGSSLSPFLANLFMSHFETEMQKQGNFPRVWLRYVDDVWAIIKKQSLRSFFKRLNSTKYPSIKFTCEEEVDGRLNFLDLTVFRRNGNFEFDIFRKPTNTGRYITSNSFHNLKHKMSAFHSMIHRALNIPLREKQLEGEINKIKHIAKINGYTDQFIDDMYKSHKRKKDLRAHTTLDLINEDAEDKRWTGFSFHPDLTKAIKPILRAQNIEISECSKPNLRDLIGGSKDKIEKHYQSGIYSIKCNDCDEEYIGQSRRAIIKRFKEHDASTRKNEPEKSSVAKHMITNDHSFDISNLKLVHKVDKFYELNAFESYYINKGKNDSKLMNENDGPIRNSIFTKFNV